MLIKYHISGYFTCNFILHEKWAIQLNDIISQAYESPTRADGSIIVYLQHLIKIFFLRLNAKDWVSKQYPFFKLKKNAFKCK